MVATRKQPLVPPPPTSRSASQQATSKASKGKAAATAQLQDTSPNGTGSAVSTFSSGSSNSGKEGLNEVGTSPKKHHSKSKKDKKKQRKSERGFWDFLIHLLLVSFAAYTLTVCSKPDAHNSPVCHGLAKYKELILEPYIFPVFHRVIAHPSISPYVAKVQPHIDTAVRVTTPVLRRGQEEWNGRVVPTWNARVVPQWNKRVVPQWNKRVVPVWNQHASPYVAALEQKYNLLKDEGDRYYSLAGEKVEPYRAAVMPHVVTTRNTFVKFQQQAQPYVILAAEHTHKSYVASKPYLIIAWEHIQFYLKQFLKFVGEQRRQFVDPQVARIWEKVVELSTTDPTPSGTKEDGPADPKAAIPPVAPVVEKATEEEEAVPPPTGTGSSSTTSQASASETTAPVSSSSAAETLTESAGTVGSESSATPTIAELTSPTASESTLSSASEAEITGPSQIIIDATPTPTPADTPVVPEDEGGEAEIDLDEFARDLGLDDEPEEPSLSIGLTQEVPKRREETEEERAERVAQRLVLTAEKRADIEKRHTQFEAELAALVREKKKSLRKALVAIRKPAAAELENSKEIREGVASLLAEADKYMKGAEAYLKTLKKEKKEAKIKVALWDKVVEKVDKKFQDRLKETEDIVNGWYLQVLSQEMAEVNIASDEVKELADKAQVSVGMDWTWLDDVTAADWQRYHDLIRVSENFTVLAQSIQKGTVPSPPINPILPILEDLESEVQDIVTGFETRLRQLKREGSRNLAREETGQSSSSSTPEVSILPIVPEDEASGPGVERETPPVIIGRSKEEVVEALGRAGTDSVAETVSVQKEPEAIVESLAHEASAEASQSKASSVPADVHVEL